MKILGRILTLLILVAGGLYWFAGYAPEGVKHVGMAQTTKENTIESSEDNLSRLERLQRLFHFKAAVEEALNKRIPPDERVGGNEISPRMKEALVATEDKRFYEHGAVDVFSIVRAFYSNTIAGETVEGGSTITQQLVKNLFLSSKRIMSRKVEEALLAFLMEHYYTKDEILTMYLNSIYYGNDLYGIKNASEVYFNMEPKDLGWAQAAMLAGMPQAPSYYNPISNMKAAKGRQKTVLYLLTQQGKISAKEADRIYYTPLRSDE